MDDIRFKYLSSVVTGAPKVDNSQFNGKTQGSNSDDFKKILEKQLEGGVNFSKHAMQRAEERNLDISDESIKRLNDGVKMAEQKNLNDVLILVDKTAFLVNVPSNTVITAKDNNEADIFTNINGAVIM